MCACVAGLGPHVDDIVQSLLQTAAFPGRAFGSGDLSHEQVRQLRELLQAKGVASSCLDERIHAATRKLGPGPIAQALAHKNPWAQLKVIAGRPGHVFPMGHCRGTLAAD